MASLSPVSRAGPSSSRRERAARSASAYIAGRVPDNIWIILCPVLALLVMQALWKWSGLSDLAIFSILFGLIVTGHHMPGWIRAFGEPEVYRRHKGRLWVSVVAIPALVILPTAFGLGAVALTIAATFDLWHVAMQQHGFGRIYAAKAGDRDRRSARLDLACAPLHLHQPQHRAVTVLGGFERDELDIGLVERAERGRRRVWPGLRPVRYSNWLRSTHSAMTAGSESTPRASKTRAMTAWGSLSMSS